MHFLMYISAAKSSLCDLQSSHAYSTKARHLPMVINTWQFHDRNRRTPVSGGPGWQKGNALAACLDTKTNSSTRQQREDRDSSAFPTLGSAGVWISADSQIRPWYALLMKSVRNNRSGQFKQGMSDPFSIDLMHRRLASLSSLTNWA